MFLVSARGVQFKHNLTEEEIVDRSVEELEMFRCSSIQFETTLMDVRLRRGLFR